MCLFVLIIYCPHNVNAISRNHNNDFACVVFTWATGSYLDVVYWVKVLCEAKTWAEALLNVRDHAKMC